MLKSDFEIKNFKKVHIKSIIAFFSVELPDVIIHDFRLVDDNGYIFAAPPQRFFKDGFNGKFKPVTWIKNDDLLEEICKEAKRLYQQN